MVTYRVQGQPYTEYVDTYVMSSGRLFAHFEFHRCCDPFEVDFEHQTLRPTISRMQNASPVNG